MGEAGLFCTHPSVATHCRVHLHKGHQQGQQLLSCCGCSARGTCSGACQSQRAHSTHHHPACCTCRCTHTEWVLHQLETLREWVVWCRRDGNHSSQIRVVEPQRLNRCRLAAAEGLGDAGMVMLVVSGGAGGMWVQWPQATALSK
jgi:hypothetical protein